MSQHYTVAETRAVLAAEAALATAFLRCEDALALARRLPERAGTEVLACASAAHELLARALREVEGPAREAVLSPCYMGSPAFPAGVRAALERDCVEALGSAVSPSARMGEE